MRPEERLARRGGAVELLRVPAALFGGIARARGALYDRGWMPAATVDAPVVCVGNLTAGGTGKTPMVVHVVRALQRRDRRPGILSRGYGARDGEENDEARELAAVLPGVPHVQDPDRVAGAYALLERGVEVIVMDDGFQHRRLARDLDLVLFDATRPWGLPAPASGGEPVRAFLPRGLLREAPSALARASAAVITRADQVDPAALERLRGELLAAAPGIALVETRHRPSVWRRAGGECRPPAELAGRDVALFSGVGNPDAFERTVRDLGARVLRHERFRDHHAYTEAEVDGLRGDAELLLTTAKDATKCAGVDVLEVELEVTRGAAVLEALLDALPPGRGVRERRAYHEGLHG